MSDAEPISDYEALTLEFRRAGSPLEFIVPHIQAGHEIEDFLKTKPGQIIVGRARDAIMRALDLIADRSVTGPAHDAAVHEFRVQVSILATLADVVAVGEKAQQRILQPDEGEL